MAPFNAISSNLCAILTLLKIMVNDSVGLSSFAYTYRTYSELRKSRKVLR